MSEQPWESTPWAEASGGWASDGGDLAVAASPVTSVDLTTPLSVEDARELTEHIRSTADVLWVLLARAHTGRAWAALGYPSFAAYVQAEFDISRSRAYQILDQARVIKAIEAAAPDGTVLNISEAAARDLKSVIGEVVPEVRERTADLPPAEAGQVVEEIVADYRGRLREPQGGEPAAPPPLGAFAGAEDSTPAGSPPGGGAIDQGYRPPPAPPVYEWDEPGDAALIRRNVQAAYDLYSSLAALRSMPDIDSVIDTIPMERRAQISDALPAAVAWLGEFQTRWLAQPWQPPVTGGAWPADEDRSDDLVG